MNFFKKPGMVAEVCNPSYSGGNQDDLSSCGQAGQKLHKIPFSTNKLGIVVYICHPSYMGKHQ
jgi:hypothetical protein